MPPVELWRTSGSVIMNWLISKEQSRRLTGEMSSVGETQMQTVKYQHPRCSLVFTGKVKGKRKAETIPWIITNI